MSKSKATSLATLVPVYSVFWFGERNYGRDISQNDTEEERNSHSAMLSRGWWTNQPIRVKKMSDADKAEAVQRLEVLHKRLQTSTVETKYPLLDGKELVGSPSDVLRAFELTWLTETKKIRVPEYDAVYAYQRGGALIGANTIRLKQGLTPLEGLPVEIVEYDTEADRVEDCILENTGKVAGAKLIDTHWPSLVRAGIAMRDTRREAGTPMKEIECIRVISGGDNAPVKRGTGQKVFYICTLDARFPKLGIAKKVMDAEKGNELGKALDRNKLLELIKQDATAEMVEGYVASPRNREMAPQAVKKTNAVQFSVQTSNMLVRYIIDALYVQGDLAKLNKLELIADECNALMKKAGIALKSKSELEQQVRDTVEAGAGQ